MVDSSQGGVPQWTPRELTVLIAVVTACLCLVILILGILLFLANGTLKADELGGFESIGVGGGLVGLAGVIAWVIKVALKRGPDE